MQVTQVLHNFVGKSLEEAGIRITKVNAILDMTEALLTQGQLTLTSIGRNLLGSADVKHKIKRVDRWLGNMALYEQARDIYKAIFYGLLLKRQRVEILVDWSGCCNWTESCLRASLVYHGRSITIYQEVYSSKEQQKASIHKKFLDNLNYVIPKSCDVVIITDRGFGYSWFKMVKKIGWNFIGRVAGTNHYQFFGEDSWQPIKNLYESSSNKAKYLGTAWFGKTKQEKLEVSLYSYKEKPKGRKRYKTRNKPNYSHLNKQYSDMNKTPWVLVSSLAVENKMAKGVIKSYASRMQIEQNFRDDKNERWGFAMQFSRTTSTPRMTILLMLVAITSYILMLFGVACENMGLQRKFQANTIRNRRVLSLITLAKQVIRHMGSKLFKLPVLLQGIETIAKGGSYEFAT